MNKVFRSLLVSFSVAFSSYAQVHTPVAHYKMNGNVNDYSPYGNHGQIIGHLEPTTDRFGNRYGAYEFSGNGSSYIEIPSSPSLESPDSQITIAGWFRLKSHDYSNYWLTMVCKGYDLQETSANPQYRFQVAQNYKAQLNSCSPYVQQGYSVVSLNSEAIFCDSEFLNHRFEPERWHFYAISFNGFQVSVYYDGKKISQYPFSSRLVSNSSPLFIGRDNPGIIDDFKGALDDIRIFNMSLTDSEVYALYRESAVSSDGKKAKSSLGKITK
jgi:hypothetical protein